MPNFLFSHDVGRHHVIILTRLPMVQEMVHMVATLNETFPSLGKHAGSMSWHKSMFVCTQFMSSYTYTRMTAMLTQHKVGRRPNWWIHGNTSLKCQNTRHADWGHLLRNTKEAAPCARGGTNKWWQTHLLLSKAWQKRHCRITACVHKYRASVWGGHKKNTVAHQYPETAIIITKVCNISRLYGFSLLLFSRWVEEEK